jgi:penicillin-binding protein 2
VENAGWGGSVAAPVARKVFDAWLARDAKKLVTPAPAPAPAPASAAAAAVSTIPGNVVPAANRGESR